MLTTISGTHGSGKTTLAHSVAKVLTESHYNVKILESFSHSLIQRCKPFGIQSYDDINRLGFRKFFQILIISEIAKHVETIVLEHERDPNVVVISDRWFADAYGYSSVELDAVDFNAWYDQFRELVQHTNRAFAKIQVHNFTVDYQQLPLQQKHTRATGSPEEVNAAILDYGYTPFSLIREKSLEDRTQYILRSIGVPNVVSPHN